MSSVGAKINAMWRRDERAVANAEANRKAFSNEQVIIGVMSCEEVKERMLKGANPATMSTKVELFEKTCSGNWDSNEDCDGKQGSWSNCFASQSDAHAQSSNRVFNDLHSDGLRCSGRRWNSFSLDTPRVEAALQERWKEEGVIGVQCDSKDCRLISFFFKKED